MRRVLKWAKRKGVKPLIHKGVKIQKQNIEAIVKLRPNPGDGTATLKSAEKGYTPLMCMPWTSAQLEELAKKTTARERAEGNRTEGDIWDEENEGPRGHPRNFHELRSMVFAFTGCSYSSWKKDNDQYQKLWQLCTILQNTEVEKAQGAFDSLFCAQITWAMLVDCRDIYDDQLLPRDFRRGRPVFRESLLQSIFEAVRYQQPIVRDSFPVEWGGQTRQQKRAFQHWLRNVPAPGKFPLAPPGGQTPWPGKGQQQPGGGYAPGGQQQGHNQQQQQQLQAQQQQGTKINGVDHVNDLIKRFMMPYYRKFGAKVNIKKILEAANIAYDSLPRLNAYINNGRNMLCYNCIAGDCGYGRTCVFASGHARKHEVPNDFAQHFIRVVTPGVQYLLNQGGQGGGGPQGNNRQGGGFHPDSVGSGKRRRR